MAPNVSKAEAKIAFGQRLQALMDKKGWNQADAARQISVHLGKEMSRDTISKYVNGMTFPSAPTLAAMAKTFGIEREELLPTRGTTAAETATMTGVVDAGSGKAFLRVNQEVSWATAIKILDLLNGEDDNA